MGRPGRSGKRRRIGDDSALDWGEWPSDATALTWAASGVIVYAPQAERAYAAAVSFMVGTSLAAALAGTIAFAVLPNWKPLPPSASRLVLSWSPLVQGWRSRGSRRYLLR